MFWPMAFQYIKQSFINVSALSPWPDMRESHLTGRKSNPNLPPEAGQWSQAQGQVGMWAVAGQSGEVPGAEGDALGGVGVSLAGELP